MTVTVVTACQDRDTTITRVGVSRLQPVFVNERIITPVAYYAYTTDPLKPARMGFYGTTVLGEPASASVAPDDVPPEVVDALAQRGVRV